MKMLLSFSSNTFIVFSGNFELFPSLFPLLLLLLPPPIPPTNMDVKSGILKASCRRAVWPFGADSTVEGMLEEEEEEGEDSSSTWEGGIGLGRIRYER